MKAKYGHAGLMSVRCGHVGLMGVRCGQAELMRTWYGHAGLMRTRHGHAGPLITKSAHMSMGAKYGPAYEKCRDSEVQSMNLGDRSNSQRIQWIFWLQCQTDCSKERVNKFIR